MPAVLKPGCGWLPADVDAAGSAAPLAAGPRSRRRIRSSRITAARAGSPGLRRYLCARFAEEGLEASLDQVMLTGSGTQAIDLVCRFLLRPGDTVLVDDPCYFNFQALLRAHQARIVGVPYTSSGPDVAAFEAVLASERPRLYITNSALHNPTGATISPQTAHRILSAAAAHRPDHRRGRHLRRFRARAVARLAVLDGLDRVIRIGSFSKTLSASIRCGYIAARADWVEGLVDLQIATCFGGPSPVATELITDVLAGGGYRKHMEELRRRLARAQARDGGPAGAPRHPALAHAARRLLSLVPPAGGPGFRRARPQRPWRRMSFWLRATCSASRGTPRRSCASTSRNRAIRASSR